MVKQRYTRLPGESDIDWNRRRRMLAARVFYAKNRERLGHKPRTTKLSAEVLKECERLPGESAVDWKRRKGRIKVVAYREMNRDQNAPKRPRRKESRPRKNALPDAVRAEMARAEGETEADWKRRCNRIYMREHRARLDPAEEAAKRRAAYAADPAIRAKAAEWRERNPDKARESQRRYYEANKEARLAKLKEWGEQNPERLAEVQRIWREEHPEVFTAGAARIRAKIIQRTPTWADWKEIEKVYGLAKKLTRQIGIPHEVDHIVPLNGKTVSGLHVHYNLQVLPAHLNRKKRNQHRPNA